jgi:hypothetical protein
MYLLGQGKVLFLSSRWRDWTHGEFDMDCGLATVGFRIERGSLLFETRRKYIPVGMTAASLPPTVSNKRLSRSLVELLACRVQ